MLQLKKHLKRTNNYWFFPAIISIGTVFLVLEPNWLIGIIWSYFIYRIFCLNNKSIIGISLFFASIFTLISLQTITSGKSEKFTEETEISGELMSLPDQFKVDGDRLQIEGYFRTSKEKKRKIMAFYQFSSEQEKMQWQIRNQVLHIQLLGNVETPSGQTNLNGFDYQKFLKEQRIFQILSINKIQVVSEKKPKVYEFFSWLSVLRKKAIDYTQQTFLPDTALYINTLIFGFKSNEFSQKSDVLADLGILHLFSLSGMHVTFFIGWFRYFFLRLGVTIERLFGVQLLFCLIYAGLTGFSISVVRALVQSTLSLSNRQFKWSLSSLDCWSISLIIVLLFNPYVLFTTAGQFSYGLSFIILYVHPIMEQIKHKYLRQYCFSLLLNIMTLPIIGLSFFEWHLTSSFFTFLLLPLFERLLLPILSICLFSSFFINVSFLAEGLEYYFSIQQKLFVWLSQTSTLRIVTGVFTPILFVVTCMLLFSLLHFLSSQSKKSYLVGALLVLILFNKYFSLKGIVAFIDVGQGDSIFIQAPFHKENILIDTGGKITFKKETWSIRSKSKANAEYSVIPFLKSCGVKYLDKVLISHGDVDHCGDLLAINKKIPIRSLYFPEGTENKYVFKQILNQLKESGTKCYPVLATTTISPYLNLQMLLPQSSGLGENKDSMVLYAKIAETRFLFTGDLEKEGERQLINDFPALNVDVLKVGHHGSQTSTDPLFIQKIGLRDSIISCGRGNRFKHPHDETVETLKKENVTIYRTDRSGMIYYQWTPFSKMSAAKSTIKED